MLNNVKHLADMQRLAARSAEILPYGQNDIAVLGPAMQAIDIKH
jgi:hypothetical protein